jgi:hypothetical protein
MAYIKYYISHKIVEFMGTANIIPTFLVRKNIQNQSMKN